MENESTLTDRDHSERADVADDVEQSAEVVDELLIEEISIDGMCGVY